MNHGAEKFLDILYPRKCPGCGEILRPQGRLICPDCEHTLRPLTACPDEEEGDAPALCMKCGAPLADEGEYCRMCTAHPHVFEQGRAIFIYDDRWKRSLERYKFYGHREYADFYAAAMVKWGGDAIRRWAPDLIVPIPLHRQKEKARGFNQARLIAEKAAGRTGIPVSSDILLKTRKTAAQKKLDYVHRRRNLKDAFSCRYRLSGERILLIDDVYTTGSTMDAAASCLKSAGAGPVFFLTLCIAVR